MGTRTTPSKHWRISFILLHPREMCATPSYPSTVDIVQFDLPPLCSDDIHLCPLHTCQSVHHPRVSFTPPRYDSTPGPSTPPTSCALSRWAGTDIPSTDTVPDSYPTILVSPDANSSPSHDDRMLLPLWPPLARSNSDTGPHTTSAVP